MSCAITTTLPTRFPPLPATIDRLAAVESELRSVTTGLDRPSLAKQLLPLLRERRRLRTQLYRLPEIACTARQGVEPS